ncbi:MAG: hypothetical protein CML57_04090 [Rhodobacteraceae bacterium]|mgnify:FL=1|nr:hypothetical protein [Paracoccaceae bacterium]|tara:strand:- start:545 stop:811 length:267 start_codon:yes stop_codon:yes gene_type:complete
MTPHADPDRLNSAADRQKPIVVTSIEHDSGLYCVDILEFPSHRFGFREFRRDPEDPHGWRPTGLAHDCTLKSAALALLKAKGVIGWLS